MRHGRNLARRIFPQRDQASAWDFYLVTRSSFISLMLMASLALSPPARQSQEVKRLKKGAQPKAAGVSNEEMREMAKSLSDKSAKRAAAGGGAGGAAGGAGSRAAESTLPRGQVGRFLDSSSAGAAGTGGEKKKKRKAAAEDDEQEPAAVKKKSKKKKFDEDE